MKTRVLTVLALAVSVILAPSCNKVSNEEEEDTSNSTLTITLPNKKEVIIENAQYIPGASEQDDSYIMGALIDKDNFISISWTLVFKLNNQTLGKDMTFNRVSFGNPSSSSSQYQTDKFQGQIYLDEVTDTAIIIRMKNVRFTIADGTYLFNGKLNCLMTADLN